MTIPARAAIGLRVVSKAPIRIPTGPTIQIDTLRQVVDEVNGKLRMIHGHRGLLLNFFEVVDFRMLSGLVGEVLVSALADTCRDFVKNPSIDGYPDLLNAVTQKQIQTIDRERLNDVSFFNSYPYGGLEVKNTFGTKKALKGGADLQPGMTRIESIQPKLDWKAHHQDTNFLLGLVSDFVDGCPQIVAAMYSDALSKEDWSKKQQPKKESTMTSFSVIAQSGNDKMLAGLRLCLDQPAYLAFFCRSRRNN